MSRTRNTVIRNVITTALKSATSPKTRQEIYTALGGADYILDGKPLTVARIPLASMVAEGTVVQEGHKRGTKYRLPTT